MPKVKDYEEKLTAKEILQAFVSTLSEKNCKEAYRLLRERYDKSKVRMLTLNREGVPVVDGLVRLRPKEMEPTWVKVLIPSRRKLSSTLPVFRYQII